MTEHPLEVFRFCPKCGSQDFEIHNALSRHCAQCGFTFYQNPRASTAAFILNDKDELLVATRGKEPAKGTLDLPGGFVDNDENAEEGMVREILEETGLVIDPETVDNKATAVHNGPLGIFPIFSLTSAQPTAACRQSSSQHAPVIPTVHKRTTAPGVPYCYHN